LVQEVLKKIQERRLQDQLPALQYDARLWACAGVRAQEAIVSWDHVRPTGQPYRTVLDENGVTYMTCNEILCRKFSTSEDLAEIILGTQDYLDTVLSTKYTHVSAAIQRDANGDSYFCLLLIHPL